jgi:hypothetical protein
LRRVYSLNLALTQSTRLKVRSRFTSKPVRFRMKTERITSESSSPFQPTNCNGPTPLRRLRALRIRHSDERGPRPSHRNERPRVEVPPTQNPTPTSIKHRGDNVVLSRTMFGSIGLFYCSMLFAAIVTKSLKAQEMATLPQTFEQNGVIKQIEHEDLLISIENSRTGFRVSLICRQSIIIRA